MDSIASEVKRIAQQVAYQITKDIPRHLDNLYATNPQGYYGLVSATALTGLLSIRAIYRRYARIGKCEGKVVFITGCDTGFGHSLALRLDKMGFEVVAACYAEASMDKLEGKASRRLHTIKCDVTKDEDVQTAAAYCARVSGSRGVYAVVANAGIAGGTLIDLTSMSTLTHIVDVDLLGVMRTNKFFIPLVRKAYGRFINMASIYGRTSSMGCGAYSGAKHGVMGWSSCLRQELALQGIDVVTLTPGFAITPLTSRAVGQMETTFTQLSEETKRYYGDDFFNGLKQGATNLLTFSEDANKVVDAYVHAITIKYPKLNYTVTTNGHMFMAINRLPERIRDMVHVIIAGLPRPAGAKDVSSAKNAAL
eukprot:Clim_evm11s220 gene=Clim_evmTU11s220